MTDESHQNDDELQPQGRPPLVAPQEPSASVAGAAPGGSALDDRRDEAGEQGINSSGQTLADDDREE